LQAKGLWPQAKSSLSMANSNGAKYIFYTEPDKEEFFSNHLLKMLKQPIDERTGVILASRSNRGFSTFPAFQRMIEATINKCCKEIAGKDFDYCYGPFLFNSQLVPYINSLNDDLGWGWRHYLFAIAHRLGFNIENHGGDFNCPLDQYEDNDAERIYRMKQLTQNINGLIHAATIDLSKPKNTFKEF
jgi:hypothetical protein